MADVEGITKYRPASFSEHNYVELEDGSFVKISELRVKGKPGLIGVPTEKDIKNTKTEFTKSGSAVKLKSRQVYEQYKQTSFVVFSSAKGSSSVKDPAMLNATIYDAAQHSLSLTMHQAERIVPISSIVANFPDGSTRTGFVSISDLIPLMGESSIKFKVKNEDGSTTDIGLYADILDRIKDFDEAQLPVVPKISASVSLDNIFEIKHIADGRIERHKVESLSKLIRLLESGSKEFCVLDESGNYLDIDPLDEKAVKGHFFEGDRYVFVRLKGDSAHTPCPIEHLRLDDGSGNPSGEKLTPKDLATCAGKKIWALGEDGRTPYELEPLTEDEIVPFETRKEYRETFSDADACKDETDPSKPQSTAYLRLKNGKYVKEADVVQPKCYNFVDSATTVYDAYVVTVGSGEFKRSYVIEKSRIDIASSDTVKLAVGGENIEFKKGDAQKVVKSKGGINNSDVVQTTSTKGSRAEKCEVLNTRKDNVKLLDGALDNETKQRLAERIKQIYAEFLEKYKAKQYDLGGELLIQDNPSADGEFEEYLENHRYMLSDIIPMQDSAVNNLKELLNMPDGGFTFDGEKLTGGAKYDYKKGVKNSFSKWGDGMAYALGFTFSAGGALVSLVSPFLLAGLAVGMVAWGVGIPIYHSVKKRRVESKKNYEYKNKNEHQSETIKDEIFAQLGVIIEQFKDAQPDFEKSLAGLSPEARTQKLEARKQLLLAEITLQETKLDLLSASKSGAQFSMVDGKGKVTQANAHEYSQYVKLLGERKTEIENLSKDISALKEKLDKDPKNADLIRQHQEKVDLLAVKNNEFQAIRKNYRITGADNHPDKEQQTLRDRIDQAKGFMMVKYFGESVFDKPDSALTPAEKAEKRQIEEYVKATEILVDKHKRDFEYVREATKDKTKKISRREWRKRNKSFKLGGLFSRLHGKGKAAKSAASSVSASSAIEAINAMRVGSTEETSELSPDEVAAGVGPDTTEPTPPTPPLTSAKPKKEATYIKSETIEKLAEGISKLPNPYMEKMKGSINITEEVFNLCKKYLEVAEIINNKIDNPKYNKTKKEQLKEIKEKYSGFLKVVRSISEERIKGNQKRLYLQKLKELIYKNKDLLEISDFSL